MTPGIRGSCLKSSSLFTLLSLRRKTKFFGEARILSTRNQARLQGKFSCLVIFSISPIVKQYCKHYLSLFSFFLQGSRDKSKLVRSLCNLFLVIKLFTIIECQSLFSFLLQEIMLPTSSSFSLDGTKTFNIFFGRLSKPTLLIQGF